MDTSRNKIRILISENYSQKLIRCIHKELCHLSSKKLVEYIQESYYWHNINRSIEHEIQKCAMCAKRKIYTGRTKELMILREEFESLEQVVVDVAYFAEFQE